MLRVDQDGIPGFDILTPSNLLSGADGKGIRCRAQGSSLSGVTIHTKVHSVAPRLILGLRTSSGTLRFNWHASGPPQSELSLRPGWPRICLPDPSLANSSEGSTRRRWRGEKIFNCSV